MVGGIPVDPRVPVGSAWAQFHALCRSKWLKMTENEPKMSQNDQNAYKMRVKTLHGHKRGCLKGTCKAKLVLKRVPMDPFRSNLVRF